MSATPTAETPGDTGDQSPPVAFAVRGIERIELLIPHLEADERLRAKLAVLRAQHGVEVVVRAGEKLMLRVVYTLDQGQRLATEFEDLTVAQRFIASFSSGFRVLEFFLLRVRVRAQQSHAVAGVEPAAAVGSSSSSAKSGDSCSLPQDRTAAGAAGQSSPLPKLAAKPAAPEAKQPARQSIVQRVRSFLPRAKEKGAKP